MAQHRSEFDDALARLGLIKLGETDRTGILQHVTYAARQALPGATDVSITLIEGRRPHTAAFTSDVALALDELQYQKRSGPCLKAATEQTSVLVRDTARDTRWNRWSARAAAAGVGSVLSVALPILDDIDGALNIYARASETFADDTVAAAETFAEHSAVTLANAYLYDRTFNLAQQMQAAMEHRAVIEQAKGIIMGERRCTPDEAFAVLTKLSQDSNRKVRHIAAAVVARAQTPQLRTDPR
jgi:GAF domain-containing protein